MGRDQIPDGHYSQKKIEVKYCFYQPNVILTLPPEGEPQGLEQWWNGIQQRVIGMLVRLHFERFQAENRKLRLWIVLDPTSLIGHLMNHRRSVSIQRQVPLSLRLSHLRFHS